VYAGAALAAPLITEPACSDFKLGNGMQWIVCERPGTGLFSSILFGQAGTVHETPGKTGVSQILRLMMAEQAQAAGWKSAYGLANHDRVALVHRDVPVAEFERLLAFEATRAAQLDVGRFDAAKAALIAEWKKRDASGSWLLWEFERAAFLAHPYGQPVFGFLNDIERLSVADAEAHYRRILSPANIVGAVIGDVKAARVREVVEARFRKLGGGPVVPPVAVVEPQQRTERRVSLANGPGGLLVAFHRGSVGDATYPVFDVILPVLNARLKAEVVERDKLAVRADAHLGPGMRYPGLVEVMAFGAPGVAVAKLEAAIHAQLERLRNEPVAEEELSRVKPKEGGSPDNGRDDHFPIHISDWQTMTGEWRDIFRHPGRVRAVTAADVQKVARETFDPARRTVATVAK
jgi:predicted Zn-dependent peptidase